MGKARDALTREVETLSKARDNILSQSERLHIQVSALVMADKYINYDSLVMTH